MEVVMMYVSQSEPKESPYTNEELSRVTSFFEVLIAIDNRLKIINKKEEEYVEH